MNIRSQLSYFWKLPLCGIVFFVGLALSGAVLPALGLAAPSQPEGTDANAIAVWFLAGSLVVALALALAARQLEGSFWRRWLLLGWLAWGAGAGSVTLDAALFIDTGATESVSSLLFTLLNFVLPFGLLAGVIAWLWPPARGERRTARLSERGTCPTWISWAGRAAAALLAYPLIYLFFGKLVEPLIRDYYLQGQFELSAPTWSQIIPMQIGRSLLFLLVCLPVVKAWKGSRRSLAAVLGGALTALVGFMPVLAAYWFPWQLRVFHGLEILADSVVYAVVLAALFMETAAPEKAGSLPGRFEVQGASKNGG